MTELTIRPEEIRDAIERNVAAYSPSTAREEVGRVTETGDGIARVEGLHSAMTNELLEFEGGLLGVALNLDVREIGVRAPRRRCAHRRRAACAAHRRSPLRPGRRRLPWTCRRSAGQPDRRAGCHRRRSSPRPGGPGPSRSSSVSP